MKEALKLVKISFDSMENHDPLREQDIGVFVGNDGLTAHGKAGEYIKKMPPEELYLGWDGKIYPRFELRPMNML
jgi:hypothetical protein